MITVIFFSFYFRILNHKISLSTGQLCLTYYHGLSRHSIPISCINNHVLNGWQHYNYFILLAIKRCFPFTDNYAMYVYNLCYIGKLVNCDTHFSLHTYPKRKISEPLRSQIQLCLSQVSSQNSFLNTLAASTPCLCDREKGKYKIVKHIKGIVSLGKTQVNRR